MGDELAKVLSGYGISVLHDRALYDDPEYNGAYYRAEDAIEKIAGIRCGNKATSCPDQLSKALQIALAEEAKRAGA